MISRFGCKVEIKGEVDAEGYVKALRVEDNSMREYHLGDLCTQTPEEHEWMQAACVRTMELRTRT